MKKKSKGNVIELVDYATRYMNIVNLVYTGRPRGKAVREESHIDELLEQYGNLTIVIPPDVFSITPSFLEELFFNVVRKYGRSVFDEKIKIQNNGYSIDSQLDEAIGRILSKKSSIEK